MKWSLYSLNKMFFGKKKNYYRYLFFNAILFFNLVFPWGTYRFTWSCKKYFVYLLSSITQFLNFCRTVVWYYCILTLTQSASLCVFPHFTCTCVCVCVCGSIQFYYLIFFSIKLRGFQMTEVRQPNSRQFHCVTGNSQCVYWKSPF